MQDNENNEDFFSKVKGKLSEFREKQVEFGRVARERALAREKQRLAIQEQRTARTLQQVKAREAISRAKLAEVKVSKARGNMFGGLGGMGGMRSSIGSISAAPGARASLFGSSGISNQPVIRQTKPASVKRKRKPAKKRKRRKSSSLSSPSSNLGQNRFMGI